MGLFFLPPVSLESSLATYYKVHSGYYFFHQSLCDLLEGSLGLLFLPPGSLKSSLATCWRVHWGYSFSLHCDQAPGTTGGVTITFSDIKFFSCNCIAVIVYFLCTMLLHVCTAKLLICSAIWVDCFWLLSICDTNLYICHNDRVLFTRCQDQT